MGGISENLNSIRHTAADASEAASLAAKNDFTEKFSSDMAMICKITHIPPNERSADIIGIRDISIFGIDVILLISRNVIITLSAVFRSMSKKSCA